MTRTPVDPELWTLDQLTELVEAALAVDYPGQANGRVRAVPDRRAIRWYTTIGLIDRPAEMRGRTALYSRRHLLQLVAIKRRQAQGHTLAEIQAELAGATEKSLQPIAALPADMQTDPQLEAEAAEPVASTGQPARARFWTDHPVAAPAADVRSDHGGAAEIVAAIRLADGVTVVLDRTFGSGGTTPARLAALRAAAAPLLAELARQRLIDAPNHADDQPAYDQGEPR
jgi:DNA-binding transcriptional MerR regulator